MAAVVLNIETDCRCDQSEHYRQGQRLPPRLRNKHQQPVDRYKGDSQDRGLHVHLRAVALAPPGVSEKLIDPPPNLHLKFTITGEFQASVISAGSCKV